MEMTFELYLYSVYDLFLGQTEGRERRLVGGLLNKLHTEIRMGKVVGQSSLLFSVVVRLNIEC